MHEYLWRIDAIVLLLIIVIVLARDYDYYADREDEDGR